MITRRRDINKKIIFLSELRCFIFEQAYFCATEYFLGRKTCDNGWKLEYHGYLMAGHHGHTAGTTYTCVDSDPDSLQGGHTGNRGYLLYMVEARCGSLKCPPYVEGREFVCAVCSLEN